jgi:hypothetical protein
VDRTSGKLVALDDPDPSPEMTVRRWLVTELIEREGLNKTEIAEALGLSRAQVVRAASEAATLARAGETTDEEASPDTSHDETPETDEDIREPGGQEVSPARASPELKPSTLRQSGQFDSGEDPIMAAAQSRVAEAQRHIRALGREVESLLGSSVVAGRLRNTAKLHGLPFQAKEIEPAIYSGAVPTSTQVESWPVLSSLTAVFADVASALYAGADAA